MFTDPSLHTEGRWFRDALGRVVLLRGVNLGGSSKTPAHPKAETWRKDALSHPESVSFVGRPFPLAEADEHFRRLKRWGLTCLRFLVTWEGLEHAGPGCYDLEYLDYLEAMVHKAGEHGLRLFIDPHQDVWSRFTGGDGAPAWTLEAMGFELKNLHATGAALIHADHGDPLPGLIWPTNGTKLAAATMFTLFFGGEDFAPRAQVDGESAQAFLQGHYLRALEQVAMRFKGCPHVIGFDTLNEPLAGYIGWEDLNRAHAVVELGALPSPLEAMALGSGISLEIDQWKRGPFGPKRVGRQRLNPEGRSAWKGGQTCVWARHGVWEVDGQGQPRLLLPQHFSHVRGRKVSFTEDYYKPFARRVAESVRKHLPQALIFLETETQHASPTWSKAEGTGVVYAPHWYDGVVLFMKAFHPWIGADFFRGAPVFGSAARVRKNYAVQLGRFGDEARSRMGDVPVLMGEFGISYDLNRAKAYRTGDFSAQVKALDRTWVALEDNLLSGTLWNYSADNTNARGDGWNNEDLSIFSRDQQRDPGDLDSGGRALDAVVRPYAMAVAGVPVRMGFGLKARRFELEIRVEEEVKGPTEVFLPERHFPKGGRVQVTSGRTEWDAASQVLRWWTEGAGHQVLTVVR